jgi:hypothetical protein
MGISMMINLELFFRATLWQVYIAMVDLGLEYPFSENRGEERDKRLYRLAHDEARVARSAFRPGRLFFGSVS